jgi:tetratricopeptide (TPR) repeat protein
LGELLRSVAIFRELGDVRKEIEATRWTASVFWANGLHQEGERECLRLLAIGQKSDLFVQLGIASITLADIYEYDGKPSEALFQNLKGLEFSKKTDSKWLEGTAYADLARLYYLLEDLKHADMYFDKLNSLPPEVLSNMNLLTIYPRLKGVYFAAHAQWEESKQCFEKFLDFVKNQKALNIYESYVRKDYAWALERQKRFSDAKVQRDMTLSLRKKAQERFEHSNVRLSVLTPRKVQVGDDIEMRLDLVNVARNEGALLRVEGWFPLGQK